MLIGICLFVLLLILLLLIPISLRLTFDPHRSSRNTIIVQWFFGVFKIRIPLQQQDLSYAENKSRQSKRQASKNDDKTFFKLLLQKQVRHRVFQCIKDFWRSVSKQDIKFHIKAGLDDPADTGQLWAIIGPIYVATAYVHKHALVVEPDFINAGFELEGHGTLRFMPLQVVFITLRLFFSTIIWRGLRKI